MPAVKNKPPGLLIIMYHVFIGSLLSLAWKTIKNSCKLVWAVVTKLAMFTWKCLRTIIISPWILVKCIKSKFTKDIGKDIEQIESQTSTFWIVVKKTALFTWNFVCRTWWHILHQLALTSIHELRSLNKKPFLSIGWELWSEFHPRHKLDFWMGDSHVTVEIAKFKYDHKKNKLYYVEYGSKKQAHVHSPHGIPHMVSKVHWWEPVIEPTIKPYAPLHSINQTGN